MAVELSIVKLYFPWFLFNILCVFCLCFLLFFLSLSPVKDEKRPGADKGIFLVNMKEKDMQEEEYEPYDNREVDHPTT